MYDETWSLLCCLCQNAGTRDQLPQHDRGNQKLEAPDKSVAKVVAGYIEGCHSCTTGIENDLHIASPKAFKLLSVWVCLLYITSQLLKWLLDPHLVPTSRRQPSGLHSLTRPVCLTTLLIISPLKNLDSRYHVGVLRDFLSCFIDNSYYLGLLRLKMMQQYLVAPFLSVCMCDCDWDHNASG